MYFKNFLSPLKVEVQSTDLGSWKQQLTKQFQHGVHLVVLLELSVVSHDFLQIVLNFNLNFQAKMNEKSFKEEDHCVIQLKAPG